MIIGFDSLPEPFTVYGRLETVTGMFYHLSFLPHKRAMQITQRDAAESKIHQTKMLLESGCWTKALLSQSLETQCLSQIERMAQYAWAHILIVPCLQVFLN